MITFADTSPPRGLRLERALRAMRERLCTEAPTPEGYQKLAGRYDVTTEELGWAWVRAGLGS